MDAESGHAYTVDAGRLSETRPGLALSRSLASSYPLHRQSVGISTTVGVAGRSGCRGYRPIRRLLPGPRPCCSPLLRTAGGQTCGAGGTHGHRRVLGRGRRHIGDTQPHHRHVARLEWRKAPDRDACRTAARLDASPRLRLHPHVPLFAHAAFCRCEYFAFP